MFHLDAITNKNNKDHLRHTEWPYKMDIKMAIQNVSNWTI